MRHRLVQEYNIQEMLNLRGVRSGAGGLELAVRCDLRRHCGEDWVPAEVLLQQVRSRGSPDGGDHLEHHRVALRVLRLHRLRPCNREESVFQFIINLTFFFCHNFAIMKVTQNTRNEYYSYDGRDLIGAVGGYFGIIFIIIIIIIYHTVNRLRCFLSSTN